MVFEGREEGFTKRWIGSGFEAIKEGDWRFLGGTIWGRIMMKFCRR